jgi:GTP cyclohydrolase I
MSAEQNDGVRELGARANDTVPLTEAQLQATEDAIAIHFKKILEQLRIIPEVDHNTNRTAERWSKMLVRELCAGRFSECPVTTDFPNVAKIDQVYAVGPISIRSLCSHHFMPIRGQVWVGVLPGDRVLGLSKFSRIAQWVFARPQIQEEATEQLAATLQALINPSGLAVLVRAEHLCMTHRGVEEHETLMTTSVMTGAFRESESARSELLALVAGMGF